MAILNGAMGNLIRLGGWCERVAVDDGEETKGENNWLCLCVNFPISIGPVVIIASFVSS